MGQYQTFILYISAGNYSLEVIFGQGPFLRTLYSKMAPNPIISQICFFVTSHFRTLLLFNYYYYYSVKRRATAKSRIERIDESLSPNLLQAVQQTRDKGASSWLNAIPIEEHGLALNKQEFRDSLCLRYNLPLPNLPSYCACGETFTVNHALSCKKGGFVAQRHDTKRDLLTSHISKCAEMWRQSHSCNHSTMKYSTFSPRPLLQVHKQGWI